VGKSESEIEGIIVGEIDPKLLQQGVAAAGLKYTDTAALISNLDKVLSEAGESNYLKTLNAVKIEVANDSGGGGWQFV